VRRQRADLPEAVEPVIDRALQKDPAKRYQRGSEMASDLRAAAARAAGATTL
jgi:serine/threonine-protein kinase